MAKTKRKQRIIAFANQKGGVAKTTTTASVAYRLAEKGRTVLAIDLDPQGNLGQNFKLDPHSLERSIADVIEDGRTLEETVHQVRENLYVIPANNDLAGAAIRIVSANAREFKLKKALRTATGFDYILIDCPPNLDLLTVNALVAAREIIVPLEPEYFSTSGLLRLKNSIKGVKEDLNPDLEVRGVVITKFDSRKKLHHEIRDVVSEEFKGLVYKTMIPMNVKISESQPAGESIFEYAPKSTGSLAYMSLCDEIIRQEEKEVVA